MSKSHWSFSGRYWAGWSATWAGLIAVVVAMPSAPEKRAISPAYAAAGAPAALVQTKKKNVSVIVERVDFGALPDTAFGDYVPPREAK